MVYRKPVDEKQLVAAYLRAKLEGNIPADATGLGQFSRCNSVVHNLCKDGICKFKDVYVVIINNYGEDFGIRCYHIEQPYPNLVVVDKRMHYLYHAVRKIA